VKAVTCFTVFLKP